METTQQETGSQTAEDRARATDRILRDRRLRIATAETLIDGLPDATSYHLIEQRAERHGRFRWVDCDFIGEVHGSEDDAGEGMAYARLFAAAPDLMRAAEHLVRLVRLDSGLALVDVDHDEFFSAVEEVEQAISRARGAEVQHG